MTVASEMGGESLPGRVVSADDGRRAVDLIVGVALLAALLLPVLHQYRPYSFLHGDGAFYANINRTIRDGLGLAQGDTHPRSWIEDDLGWNRTLDQGWSNVSLGADGETWYPKHPFLMPIASTPLFVLFGMDGLLIFNVLQTFLLLFLAYRLASRVAPIALAGAAALIFVASPIIQRGAYSYSNDLFYALLVVAGLYAVLSERWALSGVLLGFAVWAKVTNFLFAAPVGVWLVLGHRGVPLRRFSIGFALPVGAFALSNWLLFGAPWTTSYDRILIRKDGAIALESARVRFRVPLAEGLERLFLDAHEGLWKNVPAFFLALPGLALLMGRRRWLGVTVLVSLAGFAYAFARYDYLYARFFLPWAALGVVLGALTLDGAWRGVAWGAHRLPGSPRRWAWGALVAFVLAFVLVWVARGGGEGRRLVERVEHARVVLGDLPCDYFNNAHQKWECSGLERHDWEYAGRSLGRECTLDGEVRDMIWLHPSSTGRAKRIVFDELPPTAAIQITAGRAAGQRGRRPVQLTVKAGEGASIELSLVEAGRAQTVRLETPALSDGGGSVELIVQGGGGPNRGCCLDVALISP